MHSLSWPEIAILLTIFIVFVSACAVGIRLFLRAVRKGARDDTREGSKRP